jgi:hypothetical protein
LLIQYSMKVKNNAVEMNVSFNNNMKVDRFLI